MDVQKELELAFQLFEKKKFDEAQNIYDTLLATDLSPDEKIHFRFLYGYLLIETGKINEAIQNYECLKELGKQTKNKEIISQSLHQIGMTYRIARQYTLAIEYFLQEQEYIKLNFKEHFLFLSANHYELGYTHLLMEQLEKSSLFLNSSLDFAMKSDDPVMIACSYRGLGEYNLKLNNIQVAKKYFKQSIDFFKEAEDMLGIQSVENILMNLTK